MGEIILKASKISKSYVNGEKTLSVLNNLSIKVEKNEIITITGQSGSGKSTLLNILGSLDKPDFGEVIIDGENILHLKIDGSQLKMAKELKQKVCCNLTVPQALKSQI